MGGYTHLIHTLRYMGGYTPPSVHPVVYPGREAPESLLNQGITVEGGSREPLNPGITVNVWKEAPESL